MKFTNKQVFVVIFSSLILFSNSLFAIDLFKEDKSHIIWEAGRNTYVIFADQDSSKYGQNDHPIEINEPDIRKSLQNLVIEGSQYSKEQTGPEMLFSQGQIVILAKQLARGLVKAKPEQDILFALKRSKDRFLGMKKTEEFVAGRVFYKDGQLNIIMGDYNLQRQEGFEAVYDPTHVGIVKYHFFQGSRTKDSKKFKVTVAETKGVQVKNKSRHDWFVIDTKLAASAYDVTQRSRDRSELEGKRQELQKILGDDAISGGSAKERAQMSRERREMRAEMARMRKEMKSMSGGGAAGGIEQRMATLKGLKQKGLISEKEYQIKRQDIIKDL